MENVVDSYLNRNELIPSFHQSDTSRNMQVDKQETTFLTLVS